MIASGCSGALDIALSGLLNPGDNILLPKPGFPLYQVISEVHKVKCRFYNLIPENNWEVDLDHLESLIDSDTKAILVNNPSNPCGSVYTKEHLQKIISIAEHHKLPIIADEIYGNMVFDENVFYPMATLTKHVPIIAVGGLAKQYLVPGLRVGWVMVHDRDHILKDIRTAYFKLSQLILGANSLVQSVIPDILTPTPGSAEATSLIDFRKNLMGVLQENATFTLQTLSKIKGLKVVVPQGAMYVMVKVDTEYLKDIDDDFDFTQKLLDEEAVFVLPGQCFGMKDYFRVVFSAPQDKLQDAYDRIASFCNRHSQ